MVEKKQSVQNYKTLKTENNKCKVYVQDTLEVVVLGGIEEFGSNCTVYIYKNYAIVVDYGVSIQTIDTITPYQSSYVGMYDFIKNNFQNKEIIILITHCHDDHISGLNIFNKKHNIYKDLKIKTYVATSFNKEVIVTKTKYNPNLIHVVGMDKFFELNEDIKFKFMQVTHSIPDSCSIQITFKDKNVFHSGDWTINSHIEEIENNIDNIEKLKQISKRKNTDTLQTTLKVRNKIDLMINESTRINGHGETVNESDVVSEIEKIIKKIKSSNKKAYITTFSSNIQRIINIVQMCINNNISVGSYGTSIECFLKCALNNNYINKKQRDHIKKYKSIQDLSEGEETIKIVTGCQNEDGSVLNKMVFENKFLIKSNHIVIFSCSQIPTQKKRINMLHTQLARNNIHIITGATNNKIHAGGHGNQKSFFIMYKIINPKMLIPEHGETEQITANAEYAQRIIQTKKIIPRHCKGMVFDISGEIQLKEQKIYKYNTLPNYVALDYRMYQENDVTINNRMKLIKGGNIIINSDAKDVITVGCTILEETKNKIKSNIGSRNKIKAILSGFQGVITYI